MTEAQALAVAQAVIQQEGLEPVIAGLKSIRLSTAEEERTVLGVSDPDPDAWYVTFKLRPREEVIGQDPEDILIRIDDRTGVPEILAQM
jgi:hypothetical protein